MLWPLQAVSMASAIRRFTRILYPCAHGDAVTDGDRSEHLGHPTRLAGCLLNGGPVRPTLQGVIVL